MLYTILLQSTGNQTGGSGMMSLVMIVALFAIFYFFIIAPQQKKQKKIKAFHDSLKNGDKVVTIGGIYGRIREIKDNTVLLEVADGVRIKFDKSAISMPDGSDLNTK